MMIYDSPALAGDVLAGADRMIYLGDDDAPVGGDSSRLGWSGLIGKITATEGRGPEYVMVPVTGWGDYAGDDVTRSNTRSLMRDYPDTFVQVLGDFGWEGLALPVDAEIPAELAEILVGLRDEYPLYDEADHGDLLLDLEQEDWESWGRRDFLRMVADYSATGELSWEQEDAAVSRFWQARQDCRDAQEYVAESATGGYWPNLDALAKRIADTV